MMVWAPSKLPVHLTLGPMKLGPSGEFLVIVQLVGSGSSIRSEVGLSKENVSFIKPPHEISFAHSKSLFLPVLPTAT